MDFNTMYAKLVNKHYFTEEEIKLVTTINGNTIETLLDCIYARYGYRTYEALEEEVLVIWF